MFLTLMEIDIKNEKKTLGINDTLKSLHSLECNKKTKGFASYSNGIRSSQALGESSLGSTKGYLSSSGEACWIRILGLAGRLRGRECDKDFLCVHIQNISPIWPNPQAIAKAERHVIKLLDIDIMKSCQSLFVLATATSIFEQAANTTLT